MMKKFEGIAPGKRMEKPKYPAMWPSGLQPAFSGLERGFQLIDARGNLTGAGEFKKLVNAYKLDAHVSRCWRCRRKGVPAGEQRQ